MQSVLSVAKYIYDEYKREANEYIDELKLHKLLYFAQRESLAITNEPLFRENLKGWKHGPVSPLVRKYYKNFKTSELPTDLDSEAKHIIKNVICAYGGIASWKLRNLSHEESSWLKSRKGLSENDNGNRIIPIEDIRKDAEKVRPFDYVWGMYYDEFEDYEENLIDE